MSGALLVAALSMGLLGSLHCAGMCAPIMLILPFQLLSGWKKTLAILLYHTGRITVYAVMGVLVHSFKSLFHPAWQQYVSAGLGLLLLLAGMGAFFRGGSRIPRLPWLGFVRRQSARAIGRPGCGRMLPAGMLNGMLPCGLVYMALSVAAAAPGTLAAAGVMYAFGLGTTPMLLAVLLLKQRISSFTRSGVGRLAPAVLLLFGSLFLLRGLNLGIPYLSPRLELVHQVPKSSCCHH